MIPHSMCLTSVYKTEMNYFYHVHKRVRYLVALREKLVKKINDH